MVYNDMFQLLRLETRCCKAHFILHVVFWLKFHNYLSNKTQRDDYNQTEFIYLHIYKCTACLFIVYLRIMFITQGIQHNTQTTTLPKSHNVVGWSGHTSQYTNDHTAEVSQCCWLIRTYITIHKQPHCRSLTMLLVDQDIQHNIQTTTLPKSHNVVGWSGHTSQYTNDHTAKVSQCCWLIRTYITIYKRPYCQSLTMLLVDQDIHHNIQTTILPKSHNVIGWSEHTSQYTNTHYVKTSILYTIKPYLFTFFSALSQHKATQMHLFSWLSICPPICSHVITAELNNTLVWIFILYSFIKVCQQTG